MIYTYLHATLEPAAAAAAATAVSAETTAATVWII